MSTPAADDAPAPAPAPAPAHQTPSPPEPPADEAMVKALHALRLVAGVREISDLAGLREQIDRLRGPTVVPEVGKYYTLCFNMTFTIGPQQGPQHGIITPIVQLLRNPIFNYEFVSRYPIECVRFEGVVPAAWFKGRIVHPLHEHFYAFKLPTAKPLTKTPHGPNNEEEYRVDTIYLEEHDLIRVQLRPVLADDDLRGFVVEQPAIPDAHPVIFGHESSRVHPGYFYFPSFRLCSTRGYLLLRRDPPEPPYQSDLWRIKSVEHAYEVCVKEVHTFNFATKPEDLKGIFQALVASANALLLHIRKPDPTVATLLAMPTYKGVHFACHPAWQHPDPDDEREEEYLTTCGAPPPGFPRRRAIREGRGNWAESSESESDDEA